MPYRAMDEGEDSDAVRAQVKGRGAFPNIPPRKTRKRRIFRCRDFYRNRDAIERMFGRLENFRRIATKYDRRADVFLSAVALADTVSYRL